VYVTFSAAGKKTFGTVGKTPPPQIPKDLRSVRDFARKEWPLRGSSPDGKR
jgi:hypothetical protein